MNIAHYSDSFYPVMGGIRTHIESIVAYFKEDTFEIISDAVPNHPKNEPYGNNCAIRRFAPTDITISSNFNKLLFPQRFIAANIRFNRKMVWLNKSACDVVHVHAPILGMPILRVDKIIGIPLFTKRINFHQLLKPKTITMHALFSPYGSRTVNQEFERRLLDEFDDVICVDRSISEYVRDNFGIETHLIPNAIDTNLFKYHAFTGDYKPLRLVYVGRPDILRGFDLVSELARTMPNDVTLELVLASGSECRNGPIIPATSKNVTVKWDLSPKDVQEAIARAHIVLNPLKIPVISRVALEAMSCGRSVLAIDRADNHPIDDGRTGILFNGSQNGLKSKIEEIQKGAYDLERIGQTARELVLNEYGCDVILPKIHDIYRRVANKNTC